MKHQGHKLHLLAIWTGGSLLSYTLWNHPYPWLTYMSILISLSFNWAAIFFVPFCVFPCTLLLTIFFWVNLTCPSLSICFVLTFFQSLNRLSKVFLNPNAFLVSHWVSATLVFDSSSDVLTTNQSDLSPSYAHNTLIKSIIKMRRKLNFSKP